MGKRGAPVFCSGDNDYAVVSDAVCTALQIAAELLVAVLEVLAI